MTTKDLKEAQLYSVNIIEFTNVKVGHFNLPSWSNWRFLYEALNKCLNNNQIYKILLIKSKINLTFYTVYVFVREMAKSKKNELLPADIRRIGLRLKAIRKSLGFGNSDKFALHFDIDRAQYGKYEAGSQDLRISSLAKILDKISYKFSDFFNEDYDNIEV